MARSLALILCTLAIVAWWWRSAVPERHNRIVPSRRALQTDAATPLQKIRNISPIAKTSLVVSLPSLHQTVKIAMSLRMQIPPDPKMVNIVRQSASQFSSDEITELGKNTLDSTRDMEDRWTSSYLLNLVGPRAVSAVGKIAASPITNDGVLALHGAEVALRIAALESLDRWSMEGTEVRDVLYQSLLRSGDMMIQRMAMIALQGLEQGRPGALVRDIDEQLDSIGR